jgi:hypothetical protein
MPPFPLQKNCRALANHGFAAIFAALKDSGLLYLELKGKGNAMAHRKRGTRKRTVWHLQAAKVR